MEDDAYELISHDEVEKLKKEIERLKSNPFIQNSSDDKLYESVRGLNESVNKLYSLFENINRQLMKEYQSGESPEEKIDMILEQNKSIAEALVAFGSRIEGFNSQTPPPSPQQSRTQSQTNQQSQMQNQINQQPQMQSPVMQQQPFQQQPSEQIYMDTFTGLPQQQVPSQMQSLPPLQPPQFTSQQQSQSSQPRVAFSSPMDPNYPSPDRFPGLNMPSSMGAPIDVQPQKRKGLFGLGK
ncbi:MAG: hypothetical protein ACP5N2_03555 [Candidatus Nanoarchaeia archaeon]